MTDFNGTVGSGAIKHITGMGNLAVIDDNTDSMHTGVIQYLNAAAAGNHVVDGMTITQSDGGTYTTFTVAAGSYFKNHVLQSFSEAAVSLSSSFDPAAFTYYIFLVVNSSGSLALRGNESDGASETDVGNLSDGDIPIALIEINKSSAADATDRKIQHFGATAKGRGFSVTDTNGNEVLQLKIDGTLVNSGGTLTLPSATDTLVGKATTDTLTNKTLNLAGGNGNTIQNIPTSALASSTFTISDGSNTSPVALSETLTIQGTSNEVEVAESNKTVTIGLPSTITANVTGALTGNADTATSATTATTATNITVSANNSADETVFPLFVDGATGGQGAETDTGFTYNPSTGMLTATGFTGALTGNASTATALATGRNFSISGDITASAISFDGTGAVALSATIDNNSVALGTKTTGSYVAQGATSGSGISGAVNTEGGTFTVTSNATNANTASTIVFRDSNGDFSAGTISAALTGNVTGNVTGTVSDISNHDTGDLAEGTNKYLTLANLKSQLNATMPSNALTIGDANDTITIPGDLVVTGTTTTASVETVAVNNGIVFEGTAANNFETTLVGGTTSADITISLPTSAGTVALTTSDISGNAATATKWENARNITLTGDVTGVVSIDGSTNVSLATTIAADSIALGTDTTGNYVTSITNGSFLTGGNGGSEGAALTLAVDATNLNTASKVVARDGSGNFSAGTITAALSGNASTATQVANLNNLDTGDLSEGSNLYHTTERVQDVVGGQFVTNGSHTNITVAYDDVGDGAIDLSIADTTITGKISVIDSGGDGSLSYNSGNGEITYTGPSASDVRAHFSAGTGVGISSGQISIGQAVATNSNVQFGTITGTTITGSSIVKSGGASSEFLKADGSVDSSTYLTAHPNIDDTQSDDGTNDSVSASLGVYVTGITVDQFGHITAATTANAVRGITAGNLIDTSNSNQQITIDVDLNELTSMSGTAVDKTEDELVILDNGSQKKKLISQIPISSFNNDGSALNPSNFSTITSFDASNDKFVISDASASNAGVRILASNIPLSAFDNTATGFTNNAGEITAIVSGTGLTGGNTSGSITLNVDLSDLTTSTSDGDGDFFIVVDSSDAQKKLTKGNINLSGFNNDLGITSNATHTGDVTGSTTLTIADDAVTYAKMQNVSATNRLLGRDSSGAGIIEEIAPADVLTMLGVETGATADQTDSEIKTAYENNNNTNAFTDAQNLKLNAISFGVSSGDLLTAAAGVADDDFLRVNGNFIEGRSATEVRSDLGLGSAATTDSTAYATAAQGAKADSAQQPPSEGAFANGDKTKLDGIEASADVTDATNVADAGAIMDGDFTSNGFMKRTGAGSYSVDTNTYLTAHPTISGAASSVDNSGRTYIQDISLDSNGHVTGIVSATETVTNTDADVNVSNLTARLPQITEDFTIGDATDVTVTTSGDLVVTGDLTVSGSTVTVDTATVSVEDPLIKLAKGNTADTVDVGIYAQYTESSTTKFAGIIRDASVSGDPWTFFDSLTTEPTDTVTVGSNNFDFADIKAGGITAIDGFTGNLTGNASGLSATLAVASGGTGSTTAPMVGVITAANAGAARTVLGLGDAAVKGVATDGTTGVANGESGLVTGNAVFDYIASRNFSSSGASNFVIGDITGQGELSSGLESTDELVLSDGGSLARMDISVLQSYMQSNLSFTTDTNLSTEEVQDIAGPLVATGGTKTRISVTYDDDNNNMDFVVDDMNFSVSDITGATALTSGLASTDELVLSDAGTLKRMDVSVLQSYMQSNLTFTTDTNTQLSNAQVVSALNSDLGGDIVFGTQTDDNVKYTGSISVGGIDQAGSAKISVDGFSTMNGLFLGYGSGPGYIKTYNSSDNLELYAHSGSAHVKMLDLDAVNNKVIVGSDLEVGVTGTAGKIYLSADAANSNIGWNADGTDITISADDDLILHADDTLALQSGAATTMTLLNGGNVGIGTTSPGHLLEVVGDGSNGEIVVNRASGAEILLQAQSATGVIGTNTNHDLDIKTNATTRIKIEDGGNVGIGDTTPAFKLDVSSGDNDELAARFEHGIQVDQKGNSSRGYGFLSTDDSHAMVGGNLRLHDSDTTTSHAGYDSGTNARGGAGIVFENKHNGSDNTDRGDIIFVHSNDTNDETWTVTESMRIDGQNGRLGIGTTSPSEALHVVGDIKASAHLHGTRLNIQDSGYGSIEMGGASGAFIDMKNPFTDDFDVRFITTGTDLQIITANASSPIRLKTQGTTRVTVEDATTTVGNNLSVGGNVTLGSSYIDNVSMIGFSGDGGSPNSILSDGQFGISESSDKLTIWEKGTIGGSGATTAAFTFGHNGHFTAVSKSFDIQHPTKEGMRLLHGSLEGPEHGVYIRGRLEGNEIDLPDYWLGLVDEDTITVQLTPNRGFQQIYVEDISDNKVYVGTQSDKPIDCFYFIQAERKDVDKMEVEY